MDFHLAITDENDCDNIFKNKIFPFRLRCPIVSESVLFYVSLLYKVCFSEAHFFNSIPFPPDSFFIKTQNHSDKFL